MNKNTHQAVLKDLSDEELLKRVYLDNQATPMEMELALRLEHALDEMASPPPSLEVLLCKHGGGG